MRPREALRRARCVRERLFLTRSAYIHSIVVFEPFLRRKPRAGGGTRVIVSDIARDLGATGCRSWRPDAVHPSAVSDASRGTWQFATAAGSVPQNLTGGLPTSQPIAIPKVP